MSMNLQRIYAVYLRYIYIMRGNPQRFFNTFVWAVMDVILWGFITRYLDLVGGATVDFATVLLGAMVLWEFLIRASQGVSTPALEDSWSHNYLNYFASPLSTAEYVGGLVLSSVFTSAIGLFFVVATAGVLFGVNIFVLGISLLPFVITLFVFGIGIGILAIASILRFGPSAEWLIWPIPALLQPFCGVLYPVNILPFWMQVIGRLFPPTYVFDGMRTVLMGGQVSVPDVTIGLALSVAYLFAGYMVFRVVFQYAVRHGLIARFGAEGSY